MMAKTDLDTTKHRSTSSRNCSRQVRMFVFFNGDCSAARIVQLASPDDTATRLSMLAAHEEPETWVIVISGNSVDAQEEGHVT